MSLRQIAKQLGVSHTLLVLWRQGERGLSAELEERYQQLVTSGGYNIGYNEPRQYEAATGVIVVGHRGLEPRTPVLSGLCSDRLS